MIVIVIADRFKKGMKSHGCVGLFQHTKKSNLFQHQYASIKSVFPKAKIVYLYGFDSKNFSTFLDSNKDELSDLTTIINEKYEEYNHGHNLYLSKDLVKESKECLILLGYNVISKRMLQLIKSSHSSCAILDDNQESSRLGCIIGQDHKTINHIFFDLNNKVADVYMLKGAEKSLLSEILSKNNVNNMFLFEIINTIILMGGKLQAVQI